MKEPANVTYPKNQGPMTRNKGNVEIIMNQKIEI